MVFLLFGNARRGLVDVRCCNSWRTHACRRSDSGRQKHRAVHRRDRAACALFARNRAPSRREAKWPLDRLEGRASSVLRPAHRRSGCMRERPPPPNEKRRPAGTERRDLKNTRQPNQTNARPRRNQPRRPTPSQIRAAFRLYSPRRGPAVTPRDAGVTR
jgi:hypothetical protein